MIRVRDLHTHADFAAVVALQHSVWGREDDHIPAWVLAASLERGALLVGAEAAGRLVGFAYSVPGFTRAGDRLQWSHLLAVLPEHRRGGTGHRLKLAQRERTLAQGIELIEWTFDPLIATNARLNVARLGAIAEEYLADVYGASASPLHRGAPTDRLVASWRIATPHVQRRLDVPHGPGAVSARDASVAAAPSVLSTREVDRWRVPEGPPRLDVDSPRLMVEIPLGFVDMLRQSPDLALTWRMATREVFTTYFARGYRIVDVLGDHTAPRVAYLLQRPSSA